MACPFANVENACGCVIGYQEPLQTTEGDDITNYPVHVLNVDEEDLGIANSPSEYVALWNSDVANQAVGILSIGGGAFCFFLSKKLSVMPPSNVLGTFTPIVPPDTFNFTYGFTALDTTGTTPLESAYISSVDDVFTADAELTGGPLVHGANVQVDSFTNPSDKVLFIQVPAVEDDFDLWSEVGNVLQQNQPIDPNYATGSNVFFKDTRAGETIYITRSQTSFTGAVVLSRS